MDILSPRTEDINMGELLGVTLGVITLDDLRVIDVPQLNNILWKKDVGLGVSIV